MKKILITYASYGSGHKTIAEYINNYFEENSKYEIKIININEYGNFVGRVGEKIFNSIIKHRASITFSIFYELFNHRVSTLNYKSFVKRAFDNKNMRKIIKDYNPDLTISTHFFCSQLISFYNHINVCNTKIATIITDYQSHRLWTCNNKNEDAIIVANDIVKNHLIEQDIPSSKIYAYGLPLNKHIYELDEKEVVLKRYNISNDKPIYLFFGGGSIGSLFYYDYFKILAKQKYNINIIFIAGKSKELESKCKEYIEKNDIKNVKILGFTTDVFNLLNISDAVISKSGGATVTECMAIKAPLIIIPGFGGQEKANANYMLKKKCALRVRTKFGLKKIVKKTIDNPKILTKIRIKMNNQEKNDSIKKIFNLSEKLLK